MENGRNAGESYDSGRRNVRIRITYADRKCATYLNISPIDLAN